ncbi:carbonic anhydrase [Roseospirillum parvum]|uniref:Carbonic anhydrase n=1 Tax=Roseospirillum parvum TaxID=83401 RepID=A0A1G7WM44_9PROT|nr:carbonic anhydrase [Roseospirillum parvum]SDG72300.1 carbonic anhydrase [Roseospirillum parvum]
MPRQTLSQHPALQRMLAGFKGFRALYYEQRPERIKDLMEGSQRPEVLLIACSDSRVDPAIVTNAEPGELFIVRNVANLVPPYQPDDGYHGTSAAIEYAVTALKVAHVVVLGHSNCGGIQALAAHLDGHQVDGQFVGPWIRQLEGCRCASETTGDSTADATRLEQCAILNSLDNLMTFPFIAERVKDGTLTLNGWWFDMTEARLWGATPEHRTFQVLTD